MIRLPAGRTRGSAATVDARSAHARMAEGPIAATLLSLFVPILLGNVLQTLNGSINAMWVGRYLGAAALVATANANAVMSFAVSLTMGIGAAAAISIGQNLGARNVGEAKRIVGTSATFFLALAVLIALAGAASAGSIVARMGTPLPARHFSAVYLRIAFLAMPLQTAYLFLTVLFRSTGDSRTPVRFQALCVALDAVLNPLLIVGRQPLPHLGIAGSATATLIAQGIGLTALVLHMYRTRHVLCLRSGETHLLRPDRRIVKMLIAKGTPIGLNMAIVSLSMMTMFSLVNRFGTQLSAAYGACLQLWNYVQLPVLAMGMAVTPLAAQNLGARRLDRIGRIAVTGSGLNIAMAGGVVAVTLCFGGRVLGLFLPHDTAALQLAQHINTRVAWSLIPFGVTFVLASVIRASGAVLAPVAILFVALWCIRLPSALWLTDAWGPDAIWASFGFGSVSAMLMLMLYYRWAGWRKAFMP